MPEQHLLLVPATMLRRLRLSRVRSPLTRGAVGEPDVAREGRRAPRAKGSPGAGPSATPIPERGSGASNPFWGNFRHVKHWHMWAMCLGCGLTGAIVGQVVDIDEALINRPTFSREAIEKEVKGALEFRPDLAATLLRNALSFAVLRAEHAGHLAPDHVRWAPEEAALNFCAGRDGLQDAVHVLSFSTFASSVSGQDMAALAAIVAVGFLGGPADRLVFNWGRRDTPTRRPRNTLQSVNTKNRFGTALESEPKGEEGTDVGGCPGHSLLAKHLHRFIPGLTLEEQVALLACHAVGEFHEYVSGVDGGRMARVSQHKYRLGNHYYTHLLDVEKTLRPVEMPRTTVSMQLPQMPRLMGAAVEVVHPTTGAKAKKQGLLPEMEVDGLLKDKEARDIVVRFSSDKAAWEDAFVSGLQKMLDCHIPAEKPLKKYENPILV